METSEDGKDSPTVQAKKIHQRSLYLSAFLLQLSGNGRRISIYLVIFAGVMLVLRPPEARSFSMVRRGAGPDHHSHPKLIWFLPHLVLQDAEK